jgi:hypothetical protein
MGCLVWQQNNTTRMAAVRAQMSEGRACWRVILRL